MYLILHQRKLNVLFVVSGHYLKSKRTKAEEIYKINKISKTNRDNSDQ